MSDLFGLSRVYLNVSKMRILEQLILKQEDRSLFIAAKNGEPWVISGYEEANGPLRTENYRCTVISANYFSQSLVPRGNNDRQGLLLTLFHYISGAPGVNSCAVSFQYRSASSVGR